MNQINKVLALCSVIGLIVLAAVIKECVNVRKHAANTVSLATYANDSVRYYRDRYNSEHAVRLSVEGSLADVKAVYGSKLDSAARRDAVKTKQFEDLIRLDAEYSAHYVARVDTVHDTLTFTHDVPYEHEVVVIAGDSAHVSRRDTVPIDIDCYWQRKRLFGKIQHFVNAYSLDSSVRIGGVSSVRIISKEPGRWGLGPYVGYGIGQGLSIGVSVHYDVLRW
jgi:hypothetical protein